MHRRSRPPPAGTIWPDLAFVSCNGWDLEKDHRPTRKGRPEARSDGHNARRRILLADSSKHGAWSPFNIMPAGVVDRYRHRRPPADKTREALDPFPQLIAG